MTKHESPMIQRWWAGAGVPGYLAEEFTIVRRQPPVQVRRVDAIAIVDGGDPARVVDRTEMPNLKGRDIIVVQAKACRLSEGLCGQAIGSIALAQRHEPASVRSILICAADSPVLRPIVEQHGVEVIIDPSTPRGMPKVVADRERIRRWAADADLRVRFDVPVAPRGGIVAHAIAALDGHPPPSAPADFSDRDLEVVVAKLTGKREGTSFGMSPIGYALLHRTLVEAGGARSASARILTATVDPVMESIAAQHGISVEIVPDRAAVAP